MDLSHTRLFALPIGLMPVRYVGFYESPRVIPSIPKMMDIVHSHSPIQYFAIAKGPLACALRGMRVQEGAGKAAQEG